jgi:type VI secretion system protein VasJ
VRLAGALRAADPRDAEAYRLARVGHWMTLREPPQADAGRTRIAAPERACARLAQLHRDRRWPALLDAAEAAFDETPLLLDAQHMSATALAHLGAGYAGAHRAVCHETRGLVERFPDLAALAFRDGTALASADTRAWLDALHAPPAGDVATGERTGAGAAVIDAGLLADARQRAVQGDLRGALAVLDAAQVRCERPRDRATIRLEAARLCRHAGRADVAAALLAGLDDEMSRHSAAQWEPELLAEVLAEHIRCLRAAPGAPGAPERGEDPLAERALRERLARLSPHLALSIDA